MGFGATIHNKTDMNVGEVLKGILPVDLQKFGLIPEFVGRLPVIVTLEALDEAALVRILTEPKNALVKQYQKLMEIDGVTLEFKETALASIATEAIRRNTGARGLRAIVEDIMLNVMYDLPSRNDVAKCVVTQDVVLKKEEPLLVVADKPKKGKKEKSA